MQATQSLDEQLEVTRQDHRDALAKALNLDYNALHDPSIPDLLAKVQELRQGTMTLTIFECVYMTLPWSTLQASASSGTFTYELFFTDCWTANRNNEMVKENLETQKIARAESEALLQAAREGKEQLVARNQSMWQAREVEFQTKMSVQVRVPMSVFTLCYRVHRCSLSRFLTSFT